MRASGFLAAHIGHASYLDVTAKGNPRDTVLGFAVGKADHFGRVAQGEALDADARPFGDQKVAQLVDEDQDA